MRPPRGLAVPFELGRPFGAPNEPDFQRRVLLTALELLERNDGPILEDFPDDPPASEASDDDEGWACPVAFPTPIVELSDSEKLVQGLQQEINLLRPWYDEARQKSGGRSMVGISGMEVEDIPQFIVDFIGNLDLASPIDGAPIQRAIKLATDDLRHFYYEGALAKPGNVSDMDLANWFWGETLAGKVFLKIRDVCRDSERKELAPLGLIQIVPGHQSGRKLEDA